MNLKVTPLILDAFAAEYREAVRVKEAHILEVDALRHSNRNLSAQVYVSLPTTEELRHDSLRRQNMEASLQQLNEEHRETLVGTSEAGF